MLKIIIILIFLFLRVTAYQPKSDSFWGKWGQWSLMGTNEVGHGTLRTIYTRHRRCNVPSICTPIAPQCFGPCTETIELLKMDGQWSKWSTWIFGPNKHHKRIRYCNNPPPENGGKTCPGSCSEGRADGKMVNGEWSQWTSWTLIKSNELSYGRELIYDRTRRCDDPPPIYGGKNCTGASKENKTEIVESNHGFCEDSGPYDCEGPYSSHHAIDGQWSRWSEWMQTIKYGITEIYYSRNRTCNNPPPSYGGKDCVGQKNETIKERVTVGGWCEWGAWTYAGEPLNGQYNHYESKSDFSRERWCDCPKPPHGAAECLGKTKEFKEYVKPKSIIDSSVWGSWSEWFLVTREKDFSEYECDDVIFVEDEDTMKWQSDDIIYVRFRKCASTHKSSCIGKCGEIKKESNSKSNNSKWCEWEPWVPIGEKPRKQKGAKGKVVTYQRTRNCDCEKHDKDHCTELKKEYHAYP